MNIKNEIKPKVGDYVKYLDNQSRTKLRKIGSIRRYPSNTSPKKQNLVLMVNNVEKTTDFPYNVWPSEVLEILTKQTHPEMFL